VFSAGWLWALVWVADFYDYVCALGPGGGVRPGVSAWVMASMKRAVVAMAVVASAGVIGVAAQGCSTLSAESPLEKLIDAGESCGVAILAER